MIHTDRLKAALTNPPADARADHHTPLEERGLTTTALWAAQITDEEDDDEFDDDDE